MDRITIIRILIYLGFAWIPLQAQDGHAQTYRATENEVLASLNYIRLSPETVLQKDLPHWLDSSGIKKTSYVKSLIHDLRMITPSVALIRNARLDSLAMQHARDMGNTGKTGHTGSGGMTFAKRSSAVLKTGNNMAESLQYGYEKGRDIVMDLLVDEGVPGTGHRKQMLDAGFRFVGIAVHAHKSPYHIQTVIIYSSLEP